MTDIDTADGIVKGCTDGVTSADDEELESLAQQIEQQDAEARQNIARCLTRGSAALSWPQCSASRVLTVLRWEQNDKLAFPRPTITNGRKYWHRDAINNWMRAKAVGETDMLGTS